MRVFIKYIVSEDSVHYLTAKLDKQKHKYQKESFLVEVLEKANLSVSHNSNDKLMWLAPNH